ncbi:MAG: MFS transporter [Deltaproteobacteria bacterium]|nr:MFS transporter [Deltaproteobacteria bacterium]
MRLAEVLTRTVVVYLGSRFCAGTAMMLLRASIAWHVFDLTRSPFHLGLLGLVQFLPAFALTLVAGALADTFDRRRIMMTSQCLTLAAGLGLALATARGTVTLDLLYAIVVTAAIATAFDSPARMAFLPSLVPRIAFPRVATIASTIQALAFATGPALGGLLIADHGIAAAYVAYVALVLTALTLLALLPSPPAAPGGRGVSFAMIREGVRFVRSRPVILGCMTLDMFAVIFGGATALLPVYATEILHVGPRGYGLLSSALEVGALLTSLVLIARPPIRHAGRALLVAVGVFGIATIVFGLSRSFPLSLAAYMLVGVADQVSVVMRSTAIQLSTPDELRGRVSAVNLLFIGASNQLGAAESGFVAAATSATFAVVSGGLAALCVLAVVVWRIPELRAYRVDRD